MDYVPYGTSATHRSRCGYEIPSDTKPDVSWWRLWTKLLSLPARRHRVGKGGWETESFTVINSFGDGEHQAGAAPQTTLSINGSIPPAMSWHRLFPTANTEENPQTGELPSSMCPAAPRGATTLPREWGKSPKMPPPRVELHRPLQPGAAALGQN